MRDIRKKIIDIVAKLILPIIFNVVFFMTMGTEHPASVWISYGFIHLAYFMLVITPLLAGRSSSAAVFADSIYTVSTIYFGTELAVGIAFIFLRFEEYKWVLLIQIIIVGVYVFFLLSTISVNEQTAVSMEIQEEEVRYIKEVSSRVKIMIGRMNHKKADRELEKLYDLLHSSPTKTIPSARELEMSIDSRIDSLERAVRRKEIEEVLGLTEEIMVLVEERNRMVRA